MPRCVDDQRISGKELKELFQDFLPGDDEFIHHNEECVTCPQSKHAMTRGEWNGFRVFDPEDALEYI